MKSQKFKLEHFADGRHLVEEKRFNRQLLDLRIDKKEHMMYYDNEKQIASVCWNK